MHILGLIVRGLLVIGIVTGQEENQGEALQCDLTAPLGCASIKAANPNAATGRYCVWPFGKHPVPCLCDFDADGGPYTVFERDSLKNFINEHAGDLVFQTDSILLLATDEFANEGGNPRKAVLTQLPDYSDRPIQVSVNGDPSYQYPLNAAAEYLGPGYLYVGFLQDLPVSEAKGLKWGLTVNGQEVYVHNSDGNANAYFALWPERLDSDTMLDRGNGFYSSGTLCNDIVNNLEPFSENPLVNSWDEDWVWAAETHWGGGGCYGVTAGDDDIAGLNIGMKLKEDCESRQYAPTCTTIKDSNPNAKCGEYCIKPIAAMQPFVSFCDFDTEGGPYTIIAEDKLDEVMATMGETYFNLDSILLVTRDVDNNQRQGFLKQLTEYSDTPIQMRRGDNMGSYQAPRNADPAYLGSDFLYFGFFKPLSRASKEAKGLNWGLMVNGQDVSKPNTDGNPNAYFAIWPGQSNEGMYERDNGFYCSGTLCNEIVDNLRPSDHDLSDHYLIEAAETHWGGGGCFGTTTSDLNINALAIGIKLE